MAHATDETATHTHTHTHTMKKKIKLHLIHHFTKRCMYGNVYHVVTIENVRTGKFFTVSTPSLSNVTHILYDAFGGWENCGYIVSERPTGSARISSLPDAICDLNPCSFENRGPYKASWRKELSKIGFKLPKLQLQ